MGEPVVTRDHPMDSDLAAFHLPQPYPVPVNLPPDHRKGQLLSQAYAGQYSEMTALSQYVVHYEACGNATAAARALLGIGIVEMQHMDMIGSCMRQLGVSLELKSGGQHPPYWCGRSVAYGKNLRDRLCLDIQAERACIADYRKILCQLNDAAIGALINRIIADEELHIALLENLLKSA
ncbi:MAG: hypothetical protein LBS96_07920 [Oscillospiraceae bacterium]|jgi:bacterioferritin|nr:hypothetical protein [Oscillospiraceae bacterium]